MLRRSLEIEKIDENVLKICHLAAKTPQDHIANMINQGNYPEGDKSRVTVIEVHHADDFKEMNTALDNYLNNN